MFTDGRFPGDDEQGSDPVDFAGEVAPLSSPGALDADTSLDGFVAPTDDVSQPQDSTLYGVPAVTYDLPAPVSPIEEDALEAHPAGDDDLVGGVVATASFAPTPLPQLPGTYIESSVEKKPADAEPTPLGSTALAGSGQEVQQHTTPRGEGDAPVAPVAREANPKSIRPASVARAAGAAAVAGHGNEVEPDEGSASARPQAGSALPAQARSRSAAAATPPAQAGSASGGGEMIPPGGGDGGDDGSEGSEGGEMRERREAYDLARGRLAEIGTTDPSTITSVEDVPTLFGTAARDVWTITRERGFSDRHARHEEGGWAPHAPELSESPRTGDPRDIAPGELFSSDVTHIEVDNDQELEVSLGSRGVVCARYDLDVTGERMRYGNAGYIEEVALPNGSDPALWIMGPRVGGRHVNLFQNPSIADLQAYTTAVIGFARDIANQAPEFGDIQATADPEVALLHAAEEESPQAQSMAPEPLMEGTPRAITEALAFMPTYAPDWTVSRANTALIMQAFQEYTRSVMTEYADHVVGSSPNIAATSRELTFRYTVDASSGSDDYISITIHAAQTSAPNIRIEHFRPSLSRLTPWATLQSTEHFGYFIDSDGILKRDGFRSKHTADGLYDSPADHQPSEGIVGPTEFLGLMRLIASAEVVQSHRY